jgi:hypothetical protein
MAYGLNWDKDDRHAIGHWCGGDEVAGRWPAGWAAAVKVERRNWYRLNKIGLLPDAQKTASAYKPAVAVRTG